MFASGKAAAVSSEANYIEDVFSTYLYTGNAGTQTVTNGIDLAGDGGMVWIKSRSGAYSHSILDTVRGFNYSSTQTKRLDPSTTDSQADAAGNATQATPLSDGFSVTTSGGGAINFYNASGATYASWTFRKQPKFFDVVTYTGNGSARTIAHSLGSVPACMIIKDCTNAGSAWAVYHTSLGNTQYLQLQSTGAAATSSGYWNNTTPTSTEFTVGTNGNVNQSGATYIAYLFAHDAGGFGLTGTDNVISCGSFTTDGSGYATVNLGYEPQWILWKRSDGATNWFIADSMRGLTTSDTTSVLSANLSNAEDTGYSMQPLSTGFKTGGAASATYIYIAIRRGPMKVPTSGTSVFYPQTISQADTIDSTGVPFPPDLVNTFSRNGTGRSSTELFQFVDRLRGLGTPNNTFTASAPRLVSSDTAAENTGSSYVQLKADSQNITRGSGWNSASYGNWIDYFWRRAPNFFDEVCYTGTGASNTQNHNLGVVPELAIVKRRNSTSGWEAAVPSTTAGYFQIGQSSAPISLNTTNGNGTEPAYAWSSYATSTTFSASGLWWNGNVSGGTYVAYLFATCAGVSKVGTYTGTGTTLQVDCGFTGGSRFVMIKRTDSTGDWYVWDTARGIVSGNDPYLLLNSTAAETTGTDYIDTYSAGFEISSTAPAAINASGGTFIFLAIA